MFEFKSYHFQQRHILAVLLFFGLTIAIVVRVLLNVTITRMVYLPNSDIEDVLSNRSVCMAPDWHTGSINVESDESQNGLRNNWTQEQQGMILSSFYVGYVISHIPGGLLGQKFGPKYVLGLGLTISAVLSMLIPWAVHIGGGPTALIIIRMLVGISQGPFLPTLTQILSTWIPPAERGLTITFVYSGVGLGIVVSSYFAGLIIHYFNWELTFYISGVVAIIWFICFIVLCSESPASHPFIKDDEKRFILEKLGQLERNKDQSPTPWRDIVTSKPVLAFILALICNNWAYNVLATTLPKYMNDVLRFSVQDIGLFNSLPWLVRTIISYIFSYFIDKAIATKFIAITNARKLTIFFASVLPAIFVIAASYAECDHLLVVIFFTLSIGFDGLASSGVHVNPMDLSPNYSGSVLSFGNTIAACSGVFAPYTVGLLTPNAYLSEWRSVFWMTFAVHILKMTAFSIWGSGEVQKWNESRKADTEQGKKDNVSKESAE